MAAAETENTPSTLPAELHSVLRGPQDTALETASKMPGPGLSAVTREMVRKRSQAEVVMGVDGAELKEEKKRGREERQGSNLP